MVKVEQVDRDAAASLYAVLHDVWPGYSACIEIEAGGRDDGPVVQAFARHRIAATNDKMAGLVTAVQKAALTFRAYEALHRMKHTTDGDRKADNNAALADEMESALAALHPTQGYDDGSRPNGGMD